MIILLDKNIVLKALKSPYKRILDFAMTYVNLTEKEQECVQICCIEDVTEELAAERLQVSRDYVAKHKKKGIIKLQQAWKYCELIPILTNYK